MQVASPSPQVEARKYKKYSTTRPQVETHKKETDLGFDLKDILGQLFASHPGYPRSPLVPSASQNPDGPRRNTALFDA